MPEQVVMIIRHAEKPEPGQGGGVDEKGSPDQHSLTPRGWQRAGAWAELFKPSLLPHGALPSPDAIFASGREKCAGHGDGSKSRRPEETIEALAIKLGLEVDVRYAKEEEGKLAAAVERAGGTVLICWQHENIVAIVRALAGQNAPVPDKWPSHRFNVIYRLRRPDAGSAWMFDQVVPIMFKDDASEPISRA
jgi:hypothetical protein